MHQSSRTVGHAYEKAMYVLRVLSRNGEGHKVPITNSSAAEIAQPVAMHVIAAATLSESGAEYSTASILMQAEASSSPVDEFTTGIDSQSIQALAKHSRRDVVRC